MRKKIPTLVLSFWVILFLGCVCCAKSTQTATCYNISQVEAFYLSYNFSSEFSYDNIEINQNELKYTYFRDSSGECENWLKQEPCWGWEDLTTKKSALSADEIIQLKDLIAKSGFMELSGQLGDASQQQRYYPEKITLNFGGKEKKVVYQNFPEASVMPEAFLEIKNKLKQLVKNKFVLE